MGLGGILNCDSAPSGDTVQMRSVSTPNGLTVKWNYMAHVDI